MSTGHCHRPLSKLTIRCTRYVVGLTTKSNRMFNKWIIVVSIRHIVLVFRRCCVARCGTFFVLKATFTHILKQINKNDIKQKEFVTRNKVRKCIFIVYLQRVTTKVASVIVSHKPFTNYPEASLTNHKNLTIRLYRLILKKTCFGFICKMLRCDNAASLRRGMLQSVLHL